MDTQKVINYCESTTNVVGLLFSAQYCKWCKTFLPLLRNVYPHLNGYNIDIVLIGSDKTKNAYNAYASEHPWPHMLFDDPTRSSLRDVFNVSTIPALVFIDKSGNILERNGRDLVTTATDAYDPVAAAYTIASRLGVVECTYDSDDSEW